MRTEIRVFVLILVLVLCFWYLYLLRNRYRVHQSFTSPSSAARVIAILDSNFAHQKGVSQYAVPERVEWRRDGAADDENLVVHTDLHLDAPSKARFKIAWLVESPDIFPHIYSTDESNIQRLSKFNRVITFHKGLLERLPNAVEGLMGGSHIRPEDIGLHDKTKLVSMIASTKTSTAGHRWRNEIAGNLPNFVDLFGHGRAVSLDYKIQGLRDYAFHIVVENGNTEHYFSEKLVDAFLTGCIPIYWGAPSVGRWFDAAGILTFKTMDELHDILASLSMDKYQSMLSSVKRNFDIAKGFWCPEDRYDALGYFDGAR